MTIDKKTLAVIALVACFILSGSLYSYFRNKNSGRTVVTYEYNDSKGESDSDNPKSENKIKIYITGEVNNPGTYELPANSRIEDAVEAAGGTTENADLLRINLAAYIKDAQQITVPSKNAASDSSEVSSGSGSGLININTATQEELTQLPSIGPVIAGNIIQYREENGGFKTIDEIKNVSRIGEKTFEGIKDLITVD